MSLGIDAQRKGFKWQAHCPSGNHEDAHPSWGMHDEPGSPKHGLHYCFACKFQGTAADLVMHVQDFVTKSVAIDWIVEHAHGFADPVWQVRISVSPLRSNPFYLPPDVVQAPLEQWPKSPREYLLSRGVTPAQVERWSIGYASRATSTAASSSRPTTAWVGSSTTRLAPSSARPSATPHPASSALASASRSARELAVSPASPATDLSTVSSCGPKDSTRWSSPRECSTR